MCSFAAKKGAKWPLFDQVDVNGPNASPVFNFLKASAGDASDIEWNFVKFLVGVRRTERGCVARAHRCCWCLASETRGCTAPPSLTCCWRRTDAPLLHGAARRAAQRDGKVVKRYGPNVAPAVVAKDVEKL